jgi:hypothetical protein
MKLTIPYPNFPVLMKHSFTLVDTLIHKREEYGALNSSCFPKKTVTLLRIWHIMWCLLMDNNWFNFLQRSRNIKTLPKMNYELQIFLVGSCPTRCWLS